MMSLRHGLSGLAAITDRRLDIDAPGPITLDTVVSARWRVPLGGLVDLRAPAARTAGLREGLTPIVLSVHVIRHPTKGLFVVDTGVPRTSSIESPIVRGLLSGVEPVITLADIVARHGAPLAGVFFTHMHIDHVLGLPDVPKGTPIWSGPGEIAHHDGSLRSALEKAVVGSTFARLTLGHDVREWDFASAPPLGPISHAVDVFGDASLFALHVPGHTDGSAAFLVRTTTGPVLLTGDCSHTIWGWEHDVTPGLFSSDRTANAASLRALRQLAAKHPKMRVLVGHETDGVGTGVR